MEDCPSVDSLLQNEILVMCLFADFWLTARASHIRLPPPASGSNFNCGRRNRWLSESCMQMNCLTRRSDFLSSMKEESGPVVGYQSSETTFSVRMSSC